MKQPERFPPDDFREWMNRARSNLARAKTRVPGAYLEDSCFDAQQATEKAIKAVMIMQDIDFPYTHDLAHLITILEARGSAFQMRFGAPSSSLAMLYIPAIPVWRNPFPNRSTGKPSPSPNPLSNGPGNAYDQEGMEALAEALKSFGQQTHRLKC